MTAKVITTPFDAITYKVIGFAMAVHRWVIPPRKVIDDLANRQWGMLQHE